MSAGCAALGAASWDSKAGRLGMRYGSTAARQRFLEESARLEATADSAEGNLFCQILAGGRTAAAGASQRGGPSAPHPLPTLVHLFPPSPIAAGG